MRKHFIFLLLFAVIISTCVTREEVTVFSENSASVEESAYDDYQKPRDMTISDDLVDTIDIEGKQVVSTIMSHADFAFNYNTIEELVNGADCIIKAKVIETKYFMRLGQGYTNNSVVVEKCYKGDLIAGDKISVMEPGGYEALDKVMEFYGEEKFDKVTKKSSSDKIIQYNFCGAPLTKVGQELYMFLFKSGGSVYPKEAYGFIGGFMGKFTLDDGCYKRYVPYYDMDKSTDEFNSDSPNKNVNYISIIDEATMEEKLLKILK